MNRTLLQSTQVKVTLSVNLEINTPTGTELVTLPLLPLTWLIMAIWQTRLFVGRGKYALVIFRQDFTQAAAFTGKMFTITFNSWVWALRVSL